MAKITSDASLSALIHELNKTPFTESDDQSFIHVYPNPTSGQIWIVANSSLNLNETAVHNIEGSMVKITSVLQNPQLIDLTKLQNGMYFLSWEDQPSKPGKDHKEVSFDFNRHLAFRSIANGRRTEGVRKVALFSGLSYFRADSMNIISL